MDNRRAYLALFITITIWGSTFLVTKLVLQEIAPLQLTELRFLIAFLLLAPFAKQKGFRVKDIFHPRFMLFGLTGTTLYYALQNVGMTFTSVSSTVLILAIVPALTTALAVLILKESLRHAQIIGILLVTFGVVLVSLDGSDSAASVKPWLGNLLIFGSALAWACYTIQGRGMAGEYPAVLTTAASTAAGALWLAPFIGWEIWQKGLSHPSWPAWLGILYLGLVASGLTMYLWNYALQALPASVASSYINLVPIIGLISALLLGEHPPLTQILGGGLAIAGVLLTSHPSKNPER